MTTAEKTYVPSFLSKLLSLDILNENYFNIFPLKF
jgi:hypothetical protein